jgi:hypothetical protein
MWPERGYVLSIWLAQAAEPARGFHALFKCCEATVCTPAHPAAVNRAPRIVLGLSAIFNADEKDANSQNKKQEPHGRLPAILLVQIRPPEFYPSPA